MRPSGTRFDFNDAKPDTPAVDQPVSSLVIVEKPTHCLIKHEKLYQLTIYIGSGRLRRLFRGASMSGFKLTPTTSTESDAYTLKQAPHRITAAKAAKYFENILYSSNAHPAMDDTRFWFEAEFCVRPVHPDIREKWTPHAWPWWFSRAYVNGVLASSERYKTNVAAMGSNTEKLIGPVGCRK
jgi:hypothetical protein